MHFVAVKKADKTFWFCDLIIIYLQQLKRMQRSKLCERGICTISVKPKIRGSKRFGSRVRASPCKTMLSYYPAPSDDMFGK